MKVTLVTPTLSVAVVDSVSGEPLFNVVLVVGTVTVGLTVSAGAAMVAVTMRLSTGAAALAAAVTVSLNVRVAFGAPTASVGAVNEADGVLPLMSVTEVPDSCVHLNVTAPVGTFAATLWLPSRLTVAPEVPFTSGPTTAQAFRTGGVAPGQGAS